MKTDFTKFKVGTVFNSTKLNKKPILHNDTVCIEYPARLNAMAIDPGLITTNKNLVYTPGEVVFSIGLMTKVTVSVIPGNGETIINDQSKRKSLIKHSAEIMRSAIGFKESISIKVENQNEIKHAGLGSSSGLIAGVAAAINELFSKPILNKDLIRYCAQNHGEEVDNDSTALSPVQCIGGSAASILTNDSVLILAGESTVVSSCSPSNEYKVTIAIPNDYKSKDAEELMQLEEEAFDKFMHTGKTYSKEIAYRMFHNVLPEITTDRLEALGDLVYDYRFKMGSIENCSFVFERSLEIKEAIMNSDVLKKGDVIALSSVGPSYFMISKNTSKFDKLMEENNMRVIKTKLFNKAYNVV